MQPVAPESVTDDGHRRRVGAIVAGGQRAAGRRGDAHHRKVVAGNEMRLRPLGARRARDADRHRVFSAADGGQRFERQARLSEELIGLVRVQVPGAAERVAAGGAFAHAARAEDDEARRLTHRQRLQQNRVEQRENRRIGADAQRERGDGDDREARGPQERANREANVAHQCFRRPGGAAGWPARALSGARL